MSLTLQQGLELHGFYVHKNSVSARSAYLKAVNLKALEKAENFLKNDKVTETFSLVSM
jgi:hypothetical protein